EIYYCVTLPKPGGGRTRRFFKFTKEGKQDAETFLESSKIQQLNYGTAAFGISDALRAEAVKCNEELQKKGRTLTEATNFFLKHLEAQEGSLPLATAIERLISSRRDFGRSERYCRDLRLRLGRFSADFPKLTVGAVTSHQIESWLASLPV